MKTWSEHISWNDLYHMRRGIMDIAMSTGARPLDILEFLTGITWDEGVAKVIRPWLKSDPPLKSDEEVSPPPVPRINIKCETIGEPFDEKGHRITGTTSLNVVRVEPEDDGSFTAVTDHWPKSTPPPKPGEHVCYPDTDPYKLGLNCGVHSRRTGLTCESPYMPGGTADWTWNKGYRDGFNIEEPNPTPDICRACRTDIVVDEGLCEACLSDEKRFQEFRNELLLAANGLDCAGSHEASYLENWAEDLKSGTPWHAVWAQMQARYADGNSDFLERFEPYVSKLRQ